MTWGYWLLPDGKLVDVPEMAHYTVLVSHLGYIAEATMCLTLQKAMREGFVRICHNHNDFSIDLLCPTTYKQRECLRSLAKTYFNDSIYYPAIVRCESKYWSCDCIKEFNKAILEASEFSKNQFGMVPVL
jgi:hypothetical protein